MLLAGVGLIFIDVELSDEKVAGLFMWILPCAAYFLCFQTDFLTAVGIQCFSAYTAADDLKVHIKCVSVIQVILCY